MDWKALGKAVTRRRVQLGFPTLVSFSETAGFSTRLLGDLEGGRRPSYDPATLARIERVLAWPPGAIDSILAGGDEPAPNMLYGDPAQLSPLQAGLDATLHPAVAELAELLAFDSPLSGETKGRLTAALSALFEAARNGFRDAPRSDRGVDVVVPPEGGQWVQVQVKSLGRHAPVQSGLILESMLTRPDMDPADREALKELVRAALHFGDRAVLRYADEHPDGGEGALMARTREYLEGSPERERHDAGR